MGMSDRTANYITAERPTVLPLDPPTSRKRQDHRGREYLVDGRWLPEDEARAAGAFVRPLPTHTPSPIVRRQGEPQAVTRPEEETMPRGGNPKATEPTSRDRRIWDAAQRRGTQVEAADELGISQGSIQSGLRRYMDLTGHPGPMPGKLTREDVARRRAERLAATGAIPASPAARAASLIGGMAAAAIRVEEPDPAALLEPVEQVDEARAPAPAEHEYEAPIIPLDIPGLAESSDQQVPETVTAADPVPVAPWLVQDDALRYYRRTA